MNFKFPQTKRKNYYEIKPNGIIENQFHGKIEGETEFYKTLVNLRGFYNELHDKLIDNEIGVKFVDVMGTKKEKEEGNFFDKQRPNSVKEDPKRWQTRTGDMFEKHFVWAKHDGYNEVEIKWHFKAPAKFSQFGWIEIQIDLVNRFVADKEVLIGNTKKVLQDGTWEFRNKMYYRNSVILKNVKNIPIVKNSPNLIQLYVDHLYYKTLLNDIDYCKYKIKPFIYSIINKHFKMNS